MVTAVQRKYISNSILVGQFLLPVGLNGLLTRSIRVCIYILGGTYCSDKLCSCDTTKNLPTLPHCLTYRAVETSSSYATFCKLNNMHMPVEI